MKQVEKALDIKLYRWQKDLILFDITYSGEVSHTRRAGKTLANCIRLCLSEGEPIVARGNFITLRDLYALTCYAVEDAATHTRTMYFIKELKKYM